MQKIKDLINNPRNLKIISAILVIVCLVSVASSYGNGSTISKLKETTNLNDSKIAELEDTIENLNTETSELEVRNKDKKTQIDQLQADAKEFGDLESQVAELQEKNNALQAELDALKASNEAAAHEAATQATSAESSTASTEVSSSSGSSSGGGEVCITQTGAKYHHSSCSTLSRSKNLRYMSASEAKAAGYEACKVCNP